MARTFLPRQFFLWISGFIFLTLQGCGGGGAAPSSEGLAPNTLPLYLGSAGDNDSSVCAAAINNPCTDVTVCDPSGNHCQTISNILVDTGSSGLRIFQSLLSNASDLPFITTSARTPVGECTAFGNGSYGDWGPLVSAQVKLSGEPGVTMPIQLIDPTYAGQYSSAGSPATSSPACGASFSPDTSPNQAAFNGILGVGIFVHSCGQACTTGTNGTYFSCLNSICTPTTLSLTSQDQNPVATLPTDNQGILVTFPQQITTPQQSATGSLVLGIGTQTDNTPSSSVLAYAADSSGNFVTIFNGTTYDTANGTQAFIDSGSDGYFFSDQNLQNSGSPDYYYTQQASLSATIQGISGSPSTSTPFQISPPPASGSTFTDGVIPNIGFSVSGGFDWGLPFFFLKQNVYVGINRKTSTLGQGPYWAF